MNRDSEIQFREAAKSCATVGELMKALPTWNRESVIFFNEQTGIKRPFHLGNGTVKPLPPRASPKSEISKSAKAKTKAAPDA